MHLVFLLLPTELFILSVSAVSFSLELPLSINLGLSCSLFLKPEPLKLRQPLFFDLSCQPLVVLDHKLLDVLLSVESPTARVAT